MTRSPALAIAIALGALVGLPAPGQEKPDVEWVDAIHFTKTDGRDVNYVIIHTVEGSYRGCISWFRNRQSKVSAHFVVSADGEITQMVREEDVAWHAGVRLYNNEGIGIEHEGYAAKDQWTARQYEASARLVAYLCDRHSIPIDREHILGHSEIAPGRKTDPGPHFDWDRYLALVRAAGRPAARPGPGDRPAPAEEVDRLAEVLGRARRFEELGRLLQASDEYRWIVNNFEPGDGPEVADAARALEALRSDPARREAIERAAVDREVGIWLGWGKTYHGIGKYEEAAHYFQRVLLTYPEHEEADEAERRLHRAKAKLGR